MLVKVFMKTVTIHDAKTHLSRLIAEVAAGEQVVIARGKEPVARLVPIKTQKQGRVFGALRGRARVDRRFFEPLPAAEIDAWES
jgi:prevent-host-death family protein